jgi:Spy/CpxP family protein refolding chaperone
MKRPFLAAIALLTLALPVAAQQRMSGPPQSGTGIFTGITLTPAQQKQVDSIYASNQPMRDKMKAQMESGQKPDSAHRAMLRDMRATAAASYRSVLTSDQQTVFDKNLADMQERMRSMAPAGAGQGPPAKQ